MNQIQKDNELHLFLSLLRAMLGTNLLVMGSFFATSGLLFGFFQIIISSYINYAAATTLMQCAEIEDTFSYQYLVKRAFGNIVLQIFNIMCFCLNWGSLLSAQHLIKECVMVLLFDETNKELTHDNKEFFVILGAVILTTSLLFFKNVQIRTFNMLAFLVLLLLCMTVFIEATKRGLHSITVISFSDFNFSKILLAFPCQSNLLDILSKNKSLTYQNRLHIFFHSLLTSTSFYCFIGIIGYTTFGSKGNNLLQKFGNDGILFAYGYSSEGNFQGFNALVFLSICLTIIFIFVSLHYNILAARDSLATLLSGKIGLPAGKLKLVCGIIIVTAALTTFILNSEPSTFISSLKAASGPSICFIFPICLYLQFSKNRIFTLFNVITLLISVMYTLCGIMAIIF